MPLEWLCSPTDCGMRRYGRDAGIIGRVVMLSGVPTEIVGVMPASFAFPEPRVDIWTPLQLSRSTGFGTFGYVGVARMRGGVDRFGRASRVERAHRRPAAGISGRSAGARQRRRDRAGLDGQDAAGSDGRQRRSRALDSPRRRSDSCCSSRAPTSPTCSSCDPRRGSARSPSGARLARASSASRAHFLAESLLLSMAGGGLGIALAWTAVRMLVAFGPASLPRLGEVQFDGVRRSRSRSA